MKYLAAIVIALCLSAPAEAGLFFRNRPPRLWSPGILLPMITQNMGGPRMVWRGDWVPTYMVK